MLGAMMMDVEGDNEYYCEDDELMTIDYLSLSEDVQVLILTYLDIIDLYKFSLSCKHGAFLVLSNETDDFLWKQVASRFSIQEGEEDDNSGFLDPMSSVAPSPSTPVESSSLRAKLFNLFSTYVNMSSITSGVANFAIGGGTNEATTADNSDTTSSSENSGTSAGGGTSRVKQRRTSVIVERDQCFQTMVVLKTSEELSGLENLWRRRVRQGARLFWDGSSRPSDSSLTLGNNNKTVSDNRTSKWDTIRTNCPLKKGVVYSWEYTLDYHDNSDFNSYRVFVGIERSTYAFASVGFDKIIGFNSYGVGYNLGEQCIHRNYIHTLTNKSILHQDPDGKFKTGDVITVKFDLKNLNDNQCASMELFKNGRWFTTIDNIPTVDEIKMPIVYYPAISMIGKQTVSIRRGTSYKELLYPQSKS